MNRCRKKVVSDDDIRVMEFLKKILKEIKKMAKTFEETKAELVELRGAITDQVAEVANLIAAIDKLIEAGTGSPDFQSLFDEMVAAKEELAGDNETVQAALDKVTPPTPPVA